MARTGLYAELSDRALIEVAGPDWRAFLQGLLTQDVESLAAGDIRFAALLTPQGRVLYDLFVVGGEDGCRLDCAAEHRLTLMQRLAMYRLRAKVEITELDVDVAALWDVDAPPPGWLADPRLCALGFRGYGLAAPDERGDYDAHRLALGVPSSADWGVDAAYPIEADFDLLNGVDFRKGCFVGQETTSRMKRRGMLKSRMAPIAFAGAAPAPGTELLAADLRAGEVRTGSDGRAMALLRLDRLANEPRRLPDGRAWEPKLPEWLDYAPHRSHGHS
jgi:hypothetical protein